MTINYQWLEHQLIENKIDLFRYDAHLRREFWKQLEKKRPEIIAAIIAMNGLSKRQYDALIEEITMLLAAVYIDFAKSVDAELLALLYTQGKIQAGLYNEFLGYQAVKVPSKAAAGEILIAGATMAEWWRKHRDELVFSIGQTVRQYHDAKVSELKEAVKANFKQAYARSDTLLRTATARVSTQAHADVVSKNTGLVKAIVFMATLDSRTSQVCRGYDQSKWDLDYKPILGTTLPYKEPPLHPNCRSFLRIQFLDDVFKLDIEKKRWSEDGDVARDTTYSDWLATKTDAEQDAILGKGKAKMWRDGTITMRDMLDQSGNPMTLKELQDKYGVTN